MVTPFHASGGKRSFSGRGLEADSQLANKSRDGFTGRKRTVRKPRLKIGHDSTDRRQPQG